MSRRQWLGWSIGIGCIVVVFIVLKAFGMNIYAGDEHTYTYQAKLVLDGYTPYADFAMAHPPAQTLVIAAVLAVTGGSFTAVLMLSKAWCLAGGLALAWMTRRELGAIASVAATGLYLLSYDVLRSATHGVGINMVVALLIGALLAYRYRAIALTAALCTLAVATRLYALPIVIMLVAWALLTHWRQGVRLLAWGAALGLAAFVAIGLWTGFGPMYDNTIAFHAGKTPMSAARLAQTHHRYLFHNFTLYLMVALAVPLVLDAAWSRQPVAGDAPRAGLGRRLRDRRLGLVIFCMIAASLYLLMLLNMDRVWGYYYIPAYPLAAIVGGWVVGRVCAAGGAVIRTRGRLAGADLSAQSVALAGVVIVGFVVGMGYCPRLEAKLPYYKARMTRPPSGRVMHYTWKQPMLPAPVAELVRKLAWSDQRIVGRSYRSYQFYLWHESQDLPDVDRMVDLIRSNTSEGDTIFGDASTVPLLSMLTGRRIADNLVDTNLQQFRSGNLDAAEVVARIDQPTTRIIVMRPKIGVAAVRQIVDLVERRYEPLPADGAAWGRKYRMYLRRADEETD